MMKTKWFKKNVKTQRRQTIFTATLILLLTFSAFMTIMPIANAHSPAWNIPTWCYATVTNDLIGVNQMVNVVFWLNVPPPTANGVYGDRWIFYVDVTKPDGTTQTLGPIKSDPVGDGYVGYTPTQTGKYTFVARFDGQKITGLPTDPYLSASAQTGAININDTYTASKSSPITVTVQQTQIQGWQEPPLPTEYWQIPINAANRNWYTLAGNWLAGAAQVNGPTDRFGYGQAPESAHVLWTKPMWAGGIMDARYGNTGYETGNYEGLNFVPPIILNGKIYYNTQSLPIEGWTCLDLYTGETDYFHNTTGPVTGVSASSSGSIPGESLAFGQILNYDSPNQHGGMPYLWSTTDPSQSNTWRMYDAFTGNYICSIANVSAGGTAVYGKDGSILRFAISGSGANKRLTIWNTTQAIWWKPSWTSNEYWMWRPGLNMTYDGRNGFSLNVTIPNVQGSILAVREDQFVIGGTSGMNRVNETLVLGNLWALNLDPSKGEIGSLLWNITYTPPYDVVPTTVPVSMYRGHVYGPTVDPEDGVFLFVNSMTLERWAFSLSTGQQLWGPTAPEPAMQFYGIYSSIYQGKVLDYGYGGELIAYNATTGKVMWIYNATNVGFESPYGYYPIHVACIADGKIYMVSGEHSESQPLWRGSYIRCINATDGTEIWKILHWGAGATGGHLTTTFVVVADGYLVGLNYYDNQLYCYGKGPSQVTVAAPQTIVPRGIGVLITGTITDQSPGAKGTPAISDADQEVWMEHLYEQQALPTNAKGVPVHLTAVDPNGNTQEIGTAVSNIGGTYGITWTPPVEGTYLITATFAGSKSYGSSYATNYLAVGPATTPAAIVTPAPTQTTETTPTPAQTTSPSPSAVIIPPTSGMPTTTYIAIAAAIIVILAAATALFLRKRK